MTERAPSRDQLLKRAALRIAGDDRYVASAFREWSNGPPDLERLATSLECDHGQVVQVALCRRPRHDPPGFRADVARIAEVTGVSGDLLASFLREAEALAAFRSSSAQPTLAAARDVIAKDDSETAE
jgi:hypothetical protein